MWKRMIALKSSKQEFLSKQISNFAFSPDEKSHEGNVLKKGTYLNFFKLFQLPWVFVLVKLSFEVWIYSISLNYALLLEFDFTN